MTVKERLLLAAAGRNPSFGPSNLEGAGFQNCVAISPHNSNVVLMGSDVGGVQRSTDGGKSWLRAKDNFWLQPQLKVASIGWFPDVPGRVICGVGQSGASGGIWESTNFGATWVQKTTAVQFAGGNNKGISSGSPALFLNPDDGTGFVHPRSTGKLFGFDPVGQVVYAGSFDQGVFYAPYSNLSSWTLVGGTGPGSGRNGSKLWIRCLSVDPNDHTRVFFGTYQNGLWRISPGGVSRVTPSPTTLTQIEAMCFGEAGVMYAACNTDGIRRITNLGGTLTFTDISGSLDTSASNWQSLRCRTVGSTTNLWAGCSKPVNGQSLMKCTVTSGSAGAWSDAWPTPTVFFTISGPTGDVWFHSNYSPHSMPHGNGFVAADIELDPTNSNKFLISGRSGVWGTEDNFAHNYPYVESLGVTISRGIATGETNGEVMVGNTDWVVLRSFDGLRTVETYRPGPNTAYDIEQFEGRYYVAVGGRDSNSLGKIWSSDIHGTSWTDERLYNSIDAYDNWNRTVDNGWGASDNGSGTYRLTPVGDAFRFSVRPASGTLPGTGRIVLGPGSGSSEGRLLAIQASESSGLVTFGFTQLPVGGSEFGTIQYRHTASGPADFYESRFAIFINGGIQLTFRKIVGGVQQFSQTFSLVTSKAGYVANTMWWFRWNLFNDPDTGNVTLQLKAWPSGDEEPEDWSTTFVDTESVQIDAEGEIRFGAGTTSGFSSGPVALIGPWTISGIGSNADKRPLSTVQFRNASNQLVQVAAADNLGMLRKVQGDPFFTQMSGANPMTGGEAPQKFCDMIYVGQGCLLLLHQRTGLWRSLDYGVTWTSILGFSSFNLPFTGYLTSDPADTNTAWATTPTTVYRLNNVRGSATRTALTSAPPNPGVVRWVRNRGLMLVTRVVQNVSPALYVSTSRGDGWRNVSDNLFRRTASFVWDLTPSQDGQALYVSTLGNGVIVSRPK